MRNNLFKKSVSVLLSVLMIMTCWVWIAPTQAEAAASVGVTTSFTLSPTGNRGSTDWTRLALTGEGGSGGTSIIAFNFSIANIQSLASADEVKLKFYAYSCPARIGNAQADVYYVTDNQSYIDGKSGTSTNQTDSGNAILGTTYTGTYVQSSAKSYFGLSDSTRLGTFTQPAIDGQNSTANRIGTANFSFDATDIVKAKAAAGEGLAIVVMLQSAYNCSAALGWSDIYINSDTISLTEYNAAEEAAALKNAIDSFESKIGTSRFYKNMSSAYDAYNNAKRYYDAVIYGDVTYNSGVAQSYISALSSALSTYNDTYVDYLNQTFYSRNGTAINKAYTRNLIWNGYDFSWDITNSSKLWTVWSQFRNYWAVPNTIIGITGDRAATFPVTTFFFSSVDYHYMRYIIAGSGTNGNVVGTSVFSPAPWKVASSTHTTSGWPVGADGWGDWYYDSGVYSTTIPQYEVSTHTFDMAANTIYQASTYMTANNSNIGVNASNLYNKTDLGMTWGISDGNTTDYRNGYANNSVVNQGYIYAVYMEPYRVNYNNWASIIPTFTYKNYNGYDYSSATAIASKLDSASSFNVNLPWVESQRAGDISGTVADWASRINNGANSLADAKSYADGAARITSKYNDLTAALSAVSSVYKNDQNKYTPASWTDFVSAYEAARDHMANLDPNGTGNQYSTDSYTVGALATALADAQAALEYITVTFKAYDGTVLKVLSAENDEVYIGMTALAVSNKAPSNTPLGKDATYHHKYSWPTFTKITDSVVYQETVSSTAHTWSGWATTENATCSQPGEMQRICLISLCGYVETQTTAPLAHTPGDPAVENQKPATCDTPGSYDTVVRCSACNEIISSVTTTTGVLGHNWDEGTVTKPATCTSDGIKLYTCEACGATKNEVVNKTAHTEVEIPAVESTCTSTGLTAGKKCSVCGAVTVAQTEVSAKDHDYDKNKDGNVTDEDAVLDPAPTCTTEGVLTYTCQACGETKTEAVTSNGHTPADAVIENEILATCTTDGSYDEIVYCLVCDAEISRNPVDISATGHKFGETVEANAATCIANGNEAYKSCTVCNKFFAANADVMSEEEKDSADTFTIKIDSTNHENTTEYNETPATCLAVGYTAGTFCDDCKTWISGHAEIPAIAHKNKVHHDENPATCVATGTIEYWSCPDCNKTFSDEACTTEVTDLTIEIDPDAHDIVKHEAKAPTCTQIGWDAYDTCSRCSYTTYVEKKALEHTYGEWKVNADGITHSRECTACTDEEGRVETADCTYSEWTVINKPTCEGKGTEAKTCTECKNTVTADIDPINHDWDEGKVTTEPGCETEGVKTFTCKNDASHTKTAAVASLGHIDANPVDGMCDRCDADICKHQSVTETEKVEPTCESEGNIQYWTCNICKKNFSDAELETVVDNVVLEKDSDNHTGGIRVAKEGVVLGTCVEEETWNDVTYCEGCEAKLSTVKKTGNKNADNHVALEQVEANAPTCENIGWDAYEKCDSCGYTTYKAQSALNHDWDATKSETNLTRPVQKADGTWTDGYYTYTCKNDADHTTTEIVKRADYTAYDSAVKNLEALLNTDITDEAKAAINEALADNGLADNLIETEQGDIDTATEKLTQALKDNADSLKTYTVKFIVEGTVVSTQTVISGNDATAPADPTKAYDSTSHYTFSTWDESFTNVTADTEVNAVFTSEAHTMGKWKVTAKASCVATGSMRQDCSACDHFVTDTIAKRDHVFVDNGVKKAATCTSEGIMGTICSNAETETHEACVFESTKIILVDPNAHTSDVTYVEGYAAATCAKPGKTGDTKYSCCDAVKVASVEIPVDVNAHNWNDWTVTTPATCVAEGESTRTCKNDISHVEKESIDINKENHAGLTQVDAKKETCDSVGWNAYEYCTECDYTTYVEIPALEHDYESAVTKKETCTEDGVITYTCKNDATHTYTEAIPAHHTDDDKNNYCDICGEILCKHTDTALENVIKEACDSDGYTGDEVCSNCGTVVNKGEVIPATGHSYGEKPYKIINATCSSGKISVYKCENCSETYNVVDETEGANGPHATVEIREVEPTCDKMGFYIHYCTACNTNVEVVQIPATGHVDADNDGVCDKTGCGGKVEVDDGSEACGCICHKESWFMQLIYKILRFFWKLFGIGKSCGCGFEHY